MKYNLSICDESILQEVDLACQTFSGLNYYKDYFDLTIFVLSDGYNMLFQYPLSQFSDYGPVLVFSANVCISVFYHKIEFKKYVLKKNNLQVWTVFLVSVSAYIAILKLIVHVKQKYANQHNWSRDFTSLSNAWLYVCSTLTNQRMK